MAVLRYDKRIKIYGAKMSEMDYTVERETVEDAVRAAALLRRQPEIDPNRIFVLGHSLGGYLAPRIAAKDGRLAGLVFFAANARPVEIMALEQNEYVANLGNGPRRNSEAACRSAGGGTQGKESGAGQIQSPGLDGLAAG